MYHHIPNIYDSPKTCMMQKSIACGQPKRGKKELDTDSSDDSSVSCESNGYSLNGNVSEDKEESNYNHNYNDNDRKHEEKEDINVLTNTDKIKTSKCADRNGKHDKTTGSNSMSAFVTTNDNSLIDDKTNKSISLLRARTKKSEKRSMDVKDVTYDGDRESSITSQSLALSHAVINNNKRSNTLIEKRNKQGKDENLQSECGVPMLNTSINDDKFDLNSAQNGDIKTNENKIKKHCYSSENIYDMYVTVESGEESDIGRRLHITNLTVSDCQTMTFERKKKKKEKKKKK